MTDSRGLIPDHNQNWVDYLANQNPQYKIEKHNWNSGRICTIFRKTKLDILSQAHYDLIILQTGYHEYVLGWSKFTHMHRIGCDDPDYESHLTEIRSGVYRYRNDDMVKDAIAKIKSHTNHLLLIGLHGYTSTYAEDEAGRANYWNNLYDTSNPEREQEKREVITSTMIMNQIYSQGGVDYFNLPIHLDWAKKNSFDGQHYTHDGHLFICSYVERYINRLNRCITDVVCSG